MVPAVLVNNGDQVLEDGEVGPEEFYSLVRKEQRLSRHPGGGSSKTFPETFLYSWDRGGGALSLDGNTLSITFKHPPGTDPSNAHYFILGNVP
jgi:hypothetical protein